MSEIGETSEESGQHGKPDSPPGSSKGVYFTRAREPAWAKWSYLLLIVLIVSGATFLLVADETRRQMGTALAQRWIQISQKERAQVGEEIFVLPPPPPKPLVPRFTMSSPQISAREEPVHDAVRGRVGRKPEEQERRVALAKTPESGRAHDLLLKRSEAARKLVANEYDQYRFKEWKLVKSDPPEFLVEFLAVRARDGKELHFIWSIDMERLEIRALSQAARDLEQEAE